MSRVIARMTERFGDFVCSRSPPSSAARLLWGGSCPLAVAGAQSPAAGAHQPATGAGAAVGDRAEGRFAHDPRAERPRLIMAEQQAGLAPTAASTGAGAGLPRQRHPNRRAGPLRERAGKRSHRPSAAWLRAWILFGTLLLALMAGIYAGTGRYQAWQAYRAPDPLAGLSPRDLR